MLSYSLHSNDAINISSKMLTIEKYSVIIQRENYDFSITQQKMVQLICEASNYPISRERHLYIESQVMESHFHQGQFSMCDSYSTANLTEKMSAQITAVT